MGHQSLAVAVACVGCTESDPEQFRASELGKRQPRCRRCRNAYEKAWRDARPEEVKVRDRRARSLRECAAAREGRRKRYGKPKDYPDYLRFWKYGITREMYDQMVVAQGGYCAIPDCFRYLENVDHDHSCCSGSKTCGNCVRGLLCPPCNLMLGSAADSVERLAGAIIYLSQRGC